MHGYDAYNYIPLKQVDSSTEISVKGTTITPTMGTSMVICMVGLTKSGETGR